MKQLRRKMFFTLFLVLTLLAGAITLFADYREYMDTYSELQQQLIKTASIMERATKNSSSFFGSSLSLNDVNEDGVIEEDGDDHEDPYFLSSDLPIYISMIGRSTGIQKILYFNTDGEDAEDVIHLSQHIVQYYEPGKMEIGNLFESRYVWYYVSPFTLIIFDTSSINGEMIRMVLYSIPLILAEAGLIFWISRRLTQWMIEPIEAAFEKQKEFIADASHELKTPVAVILASAEAMERDGNPKWLANIESEADRMNALIKSLLDLTKSEEEKLVLQNVNLSFLAEKEIMIQEAVMFEKGITLVSDIPEDIHVMGVQEMIVKVLEVLLDNALHHSDGLVRVTLQKEGKFALLRVENNGTLIPDEEKEKIFERFYRSDKSRNRQENRYGLGLAIARNLMTRMQGSIYVQDHDGLTSFCMKLRLAD